MHGHTECGPFSHFAARIKRLSRSCRQVVLFGLLGCQPADRPDGIHLQEAPLWGSRDGWVVGTPSPPWQQSTTSPLFHEIGALSRLPEGQIVVADRLDAVRMLDHSGNVAARFGALGDGASEYRSADAVWAGPGDTLWIGDGVRRRVLGFSKTGVFLRGYSIEGLPGYASTRVIGFLPSGDPVLQGLRLVRPAAPAVVGPLPPNHLIWHRFDRVNRLAVRLASAPWRQEWSARWREGYAEGSVVFGRKSVASVVPDGLVVFHDTLWFALDRVDSTGAFRGRFGRMGGLRRVTDGDVRAETAQVLGRAQSPTQEQEWSRWLESLPARQQFPAVSRVLTDPAGGVWAQHFVSPVDTVSWWSVFDGNWVWLGDLHTPIRFAPFEIGTDYVLGVLTDSLGIESVAIASLDRPSPGGPLVASPEESP